LGEVRIIGLKLNAFVAHLDEIQRFCGTFGWDSTLQRHTWVRFNASAAHLDEIQRFCGTFGWDSTLLQHTWMRFNASAAHFWLHINAHVVHSSHSLFPSQSRSHHQQSSPSIPKEWMNRLIDSRVCLSRSTIFDFNFLFVFVHFSFARNFLIAELSSEILPAISFIRRYIHITTLDHFSLSTGGKVLNNIKTAIKVIFLLQSPSTLARERVSLTQWKKNSEMPWNIFRCFLWLYIDKHARTQQQNRVHCVKINFN
jgi:hypothetical protein